MTKMTPLLERNEQFAATYTSLSPKVSVSGHVYDIATGRVTSGLDARHPHLVGNN